MNIDNRHDRGLGSANLTDVVALAGCGERKRALRPDRAAGAGPTAVWIRLSPVRSTSPVVGVSTAWIRLEPVNAACPLRLPRYVPVAQTSTADMHAGPDTGRRVSVPLTFLHLTAARAPPLARVSTATTESTSTANLRHLDVYRSTIHACSAFIHESCVWTVSVCGILLHRPRDELSTRVLHWWQQKATIDTAFFHRRRLTRKGVVILLCPCNISLLGWTMYR